MSGLAGVLRRFEFAIHLFHAVRLYEDTRQASAGLPPVSLLAGADGWCYSTVGFMMFKYLSLEIPNVGC